MSCRVQRCTNVADEVLEYSEPDNPFTHQMPVCAFHKAKMDSGEEWISISGDPNPEAPHSIVMGDDLRETEWQFYEGTECGWNSAFSSEFGKLEYWTIRARRAGTTSSETFKLAMNPEIARQLQASLTWWSDRSA